MPHLSSSDFDLVLASSSPRRMEILNQLGVRYQAVSPMIDESLRYGESGEEYVRRLALDKASALAMHELSPPILGADTAIVCRGEVFVKPQDFEQFKEMLEAPHRQLIFHACAEDLEVLEYALGIKASTIFDTQIAAGITNIGYSMGYARLVAQMFDVELGKQETRSDWLARPLTDKQKQYAADDVQNNKQIHRVMDDG